jgi:hypothetical protein
MSDQVQTEDQAGTQATQKAAKSLSGGEKSFATICLLLALWEAIGCPIRCLGSAPTRCLDLQLLTLYIR